MLMLSHAIWVVVCYDICMDKNIEAVTKNNDNTEENAVAMSGWDTLMGKVDVNDMVEEEGYFTDSELVDMDKTVSEYSDKIEPFMLKKCFSGWTKRKDRYRKEFHEMFEESCAELDDIDGFADWFYLGTIYRDYLSTILGLRNQWYDVFFLVTEDDEDVKIDDCAERVAWYDSDKHTVNFVFDKSMSLLEYLGSIAHEMWHAHQNWVADNGADVKLSEKYRTMFDQYCSGRGSRVDAYRKQVLEGEARMFERHFTRELELACEKYPDMEKALISAFDESGGDDYCDDDDEFGICFEENDYVEMEERFLRGISEDGFFSDWAHDSLWWATMKGVSSEKRKD